MKNKYILSSIIAIVLSGTALAEKNDLKASDEELDLLSAEAGQTEMKEVVPANNLAVEPAVKPSGSTDVEALSEKVAEQLSGIMGTSDKSAPKETEAKLEKMVTSTLLEGVKMDDLRSAVSAAMLEASEQEGVSAEQVELTSESLSKLVGEAGTDADTDEYLKQQKQEAEQFAKSEKPVESTASSDAVSNNENSAAETGEQTVTVQAGESLFKIALRVYGSGDSYLRLYNANKDSLSDPNIVQVGQVLRIPR